MLQINAGDGKLDVPISPKRSLGDFPGVELAVKDINEKVAVLTSGLANCQAQSVRCILSSNVDFAVYCSLFTSYRTY